MVGNTLKSTGRPDVHRGHHHHYRQHDVDDDQEIQQDAGIGVISATMIAITPTGTPYSVQLKGTR